MRVTPSASSQTIARTERIPFDGHVNNFLHVLKMKKDQLLPNCKEYYNLGLCEEWFHRSMIHCLPCPSQVIPHNPSSELHEVSIPFTVRK